MIIMRESLAQALWKSKKVKVKYVHLKWKYEQIFTNSTPDNLHTKIRGRCDCFSITHTVPLHLRDSCEQ